MTRTKNRACNGKVAYTKAEAQKKVKELRVRYLGRYHAYPCDYGDHYHVGHRPKPKNKGRRRR